MKKILILLLVGIVVFSSIEVQAQTDNDYKKFFKFTLRNRPDKVAGLIKKRKNINSRSKLGVTPLLYSLLQNKPNIAEILINADANVNLSDNNEIGSLQYAIQFCTNTDIIYKLVDRGADINHVSKDMQTPFHYSILYKCSTIPFYLIEKGADYQQLTIYGENSIHLAAYSGCDSVFSFLLQQGLDYDLKENSGNTPLMYALENHNHSIAEKLLNLGADVMIENEKHYTPLYYAIEDGDTQIFDQLIEKGARTDVAVNNVPPIYVAAAKENEYFVKVLLLNGVQNPMKCDIHDVCYQTAFIYSVSASLADDNEKLALYQNSLNIYNLAKEKYKGELNKIRAKNTAKFCGEVCLNLLAIYGGSYTSGSIADYQAERRAYLKDRIDKCDAKIKELIDIIATLK